MSTGKRLAKRSIVGTRVCVPKDDFFLPGVIHAVKSSPGGLFNTGENKYSVRLDAPHPRTVSEYMEKELVGPGFRSIAGLSLKEGQRVFLTHNGREVSATLVVHTRGDNKDEVTVNLNPSGMEVSTLSDPVLLIYKTFRRPALPRPLSLPFCSFSRRLCVVALLPVAKAGSFAPTAAFQGHRPPFAGVKVKIRPWLDFCLITLCW
jgi:hypothetical protein